MTNCDELIRSGFDDASLIEVNSDGSLYDFKIEYYDENDNEKSAKVSISDVNYVLREDILIQGFKMETTFGEIMSLKQEGEDVTLLLTWIDFSLRSRVTHFYKMLGAKIQSVAELS